MIDEVRNTVMHFLNKDNNGYISPDLFNNFARMAQLEIIEEHFHDYNRAMEKMNNRISGTGYGDIPKHIREIFSLLTVKDTVLLYNVDHFTLPNEDNLIDNADPLNGEYDISVDGIWYKTISINYNYSSEIERVEPVDIIRMNNSTLTAPSASFPVYTQSGNSIYVYPNNISSNVFMSYIRYPRDPKWTYTSLSGGEPIFDQSATDYQDFELPKEDIPKLVIKICKFSGIEIREPEVVQVFMTEEQYKKQIEQ